MPKSRSGPQIMKHLPKAIVLIFVTLLFACGSSATATPSGAPSSTAMPQATPVPSTGGDSGRPTPLPEATRAPVSEVKPTGSLNHGVTETGIFQGHPSEASSPRVQYMSSSIGEGLVTIGEDIQANPMIAASWDISDDFLTWTWKLQPGIQFHKGYGEMTAEDVVYSAEQFYLGAKLARAGIMGDYYGYNDKGNSSTEVIDDLTFVVTNSKPWVPAVVFEFSRNAAGVSFWAVSEKQSEELGIGKASVDIASTGPWEIVEHESGTFWKFRAVEDHWRQTPYFAELVYWTIPEESARVAGFLTGSLDIFTMAFDSIPTVEALEGAVITGWANGGQAGLNFYGQLNGLTKDGEEYEFFNCEQAWVSCDADTDSEEWARAVMVRKAMNISIDRQAIVDELLSGFGRVQSVRDWMGHDARANPDWAYEFNPDLARQMLSDAGFPDGFNITLTPAIRGAPAEVEACHAVAQYFEEIGISVSIQNIPYATLRPSLITRKYQGITCLTVGTRLSPIIGASNYTTDSTYSYGTHHPWLDEHVWATQAQVDIEKIHAGELEIYNWIWENSTSSSLYVHDGLWPAGPRIDPDWRPTDFSDMKAPSGFEFVKHR